MFSLRSALAYAAAAIGWHAPKSLTAVSPIHTDTAARLASGVPSGRAHGRSTPGAFGGKSRFARATGW